MWKDVVKKNKNYVLFLIGDGRLKSGIEEKVKELNLQDNVVFTGMAFNVPEYLSAMDVMVLPSLYEGLPYVLIEWQDAGVPCLVADTVTPDCKLTEDVKFIPLDKELWMNEILACKPILDRISESKLNQVRIKEAGYSITDNAQKLKDFYFKKLK